MDQKSNCFICGKELVYLDGTEDLECFYCGEVHAANAKCAAGHYVCDRCHSAGGNDLIERYCLRSTSTDPVEMALALMANPQIKMHGPEHHYLVPAVLIAAYANSTGMDSTRKMENLSKARQRAQKILGGFCGFYGDCGAAVGTGIAVSVLTGATPLSQKEWKLSNLITAKSLLTIAEHGGPRCCKRNSFLAIVEASAFFKEHLGVEMTVDGDISCPFSPLNRECLKDQCPFHPR